jgi:hypothetical protein
MSAGRELVAWCRRNPAAIQVVIALLALAAGVLVYVMDRDPAQTYFLPEGFGASGMEPLAFGRIGRYLPDFLHVYAFILLTCAILRPGAGGVLKISVVWFLLDACFEIGQHPAVSPFVAAYTPDWFGHLPVLENTRSFFLRGYFDPLDLIAFTLGAIGAWLTVILMPRYEAAGSAAPAGIRNAKP